MVNLTQSDDLINTVEVTGSQDQQWSWCFEVGPSLQQDGFITRPSASPDDGLLWKGDGCVLLTRQGLQITPFVGIENLYTSHHLLEQWTQPLPPAIARSFSTRDHRHGNASFLAGGDPAGPEFALDENEASRSSSVEPGPDHKGEVQWGRKGTGDGCSPRAGGNPGGAEMWGNRLHSAVLP